VCPACRHHLKSGASKTDARAAQSETAFAVDGTVVHPPNGAPWEYAVVVTVRDDKGKEVARNVVNVGVLNGAAQRSFTLSVEVFKPH
jgi:hypothetical protein